MAARKSGEKPCPIRNEGLIRRLTTCAALAVAGGGGCRGGREKCGTREYHSGSGAHGKEAIHRKLPSSIGALPCDFVSPGGHTRLCVSLTGVVRLLVVSPRLASATSSSPLRVQMPPGRPVFQGRDRRKIVSDIPRFN